MKSLFEPSTAEEIQQRLCLLQPESQRLWGKMTAPQMLAHCSVAMETAVGDVVLPRMFVGRVLGPLFKSQFTNEKPLSKNGPTAPGLVVSDERDLSRERERLAKLVERFSRGGPERCTTAQHCFFGKLTPEQWAMGMYKHIDHHLRQFGV
jgi:hypothetical protein